MNAGIAFISRKSRKTDVAWRYATVPHVVAADAIVLAADCTVTRTDAVREQNEKIVRLGKQILGCIVYE